MAVQPQPPDSRRLAPEDRGSRGAVSARVVAFTALGLAGAGALAWCLLDVQRAHHDDPIVIDNPQIDIYRRGLTHPEPTYDTGNKKWALGDAYALTHITVHSTSKDDQGKKRTYSLTKAVSSGASFDFHLIDGGSSAASFAIAPEGSSSNKTARVIPASDFGFSKNGKKITPANGKRNIGQITFGTQSICVADGPAPTEAPCNSWGHKPDELKVLLCSSESKCRQYQ